MTISELRWHSMVYSFVYIFSATLNEYKQKVIHLKELRKNMSASDSEQELDTSDVFVLAQKTHELEDIVRSLQTMEDPQMRYAGS
jgi:ketopantoate reductase